MQPDITYFDDFECVLFEASPYRSEILKQIDQDFADLKKDPFNKPTLMQLVDHVRQFTGIQDIRISIKRGYNNASIICIYNNDFFSIGIPNILKKYTYEKSLKNIQTIREPVE